MAHHHHHHHAHDLHDHFHDHHDHAHHEHDHGHIHDAHEPAHAAAAGLVGEAGAAVVELHFQLRLWAMLAILLTSLLGAIPPLFLKSFRNSRSAATRLVRAFSAGIILALALVHIVPEALEDLSHIPGPFPWGPTAVAAGLVGLIILEHASHLARQRQALAAPNGYAGALNGKPAQPGVNGSGNGGGGSAVANSPGKITQARPRAAVAGKASAAAVQHVHSPECGGAHKHDDHGADGDVANTEADAETWRKQQRRFQETLQQQVSAYVMELGCVVHSFVIGFALGSSNEVHSHGGGGHSHGHSHGSHDHGHEHEHGSGDVATQLIILTAALCLHQLLEGITLAAALARAAFPIRKSLTMAFGYSLTVPLGIAAGMAATVGQYDPNAPAAAALRGAANAVSAGMLLYIALVQLVAEDFGFHGSGDGSGANETSDGAGKHGHDHAHDHGSHGHEHGAFCRHGHSHGGGDGGSGGVMSWRMAMAMYAAVTGGAACMCLLALWA